LQNKSGESLTWRGTGSLRPPFSRRGRKSGDHQPFTNKIQGNLESPSQNHNQGLIRAIFRSEEDIIDSEETSIIQCCKGPLALRRTVSVWSTWSRGSLLPRGWTLVSTFCTRMSRFRLNPLAITGFLRQYIRFSGLFCILDG